MQVTALFLAAAIASVSAKPTDCPTATTVAPLSTATLAGASFPGVTATIGVTATTLAPQPTVYGGDASGNYNPYKGTGVYGSPDANVGDYKPPSQNYTAPAANTAAYVAPAAKNLYSGSMTAVVSGVVAGLLALIM
ncbi:hypothetical protein BCR33DRAFT_785763 [Rhizoclosmatium globosum]|uniref:Uncharacterized protein n=1 Tax=Rhizoclosmatium globosum TaxID=329046 RepID=A0A1Y2C8N5_9FUNG|nr:hypothetical protein HDU79_006232 [Rhizoclosmatium sp. JEL0117]ORY43393.1 hypothetical protein BCR33DRAFT_785763 [Rhizoclosmatium globosum]|eukprot:ORY43393.1 hypothetical protein BCR33DRAFT_785763 [Rhizoclosmatium globosum]